MKIKILHSYGYALSAYDLVIDNEFWSYEAYEISGRTILKKYDRGNTITVHKIPMTLPLNEQDPQETIDKFYKLLLLK